LAQSLKPLGQVFVISPDREQSGVGTAITLHHPVRIMEWPSPVKDVTAYAVEGTPSDCTIVALESLIGKRIDVFFSGINEGANLGDDVFVSGTVAAAWQAYFRGIPAIAMSVAALRDLKYEVATQLAKVIAIKVAEGALPKPLFLNINVPNLPIKNVQGIEITRLGGQGFLDIVSEGNDGRRKWYWIARSRPTPNVEEGTDIWAVRNARVSITPFNSHLTEPQHIETLNELKESFLEPLRPKGLASRPAPPPRPFPPPRPSEDNMGG